MGLSLAKSIAALHEFDSVPEWIRTIKSPSIRQGIIPANSESLLLKAVRKFIKVGHAKSRVRLLLRNKILLNAEVQNHRSRAKPTSAASCQRIRLLLFGHPESIPEKLARLLLLAGWHCHLHVI